MDLIWRLLIYLKFGVDLIWRMVNYLKFGEFYQNLPNSPNFVHLKLHLHLYRQGGHSYWKNWKILENTWKKNWYLIILENFKFQPFSSIILEKALIFFIGHTFFITLSIYFLN